ncbi:MAG: VWA domain-containing protein [Thermoanaerobaculia bacterium]|nr:VWA domain-containing protein [Thermoanaerobaculia bacterium]
MIVAGQPVVISHPRHLPAVVVLAGLVLAAAAPQPATSERDVTVPVSVRDASGKIPTDLSPADFVATLAGQPVPVVAVTPARGEPVLVYFDSALATSEGLTAAARLLERAAAQLVRFGPVEVVFAGPDPEVLMEPSHSADDVEEAFEAVGDEASVDDSLSSFRERWGETPAAERNAAVQSFNLDLETRVLIRSLDGLAATALARAPGLLLWVSDGFDPDPRSFYQAPRTGTAPTTERLRALAPELAVAGWTVVPIALGSPAAFKDRDVPLRTLADETGGRVVSSPLDLDGVLAELAARTHLTLRLAGESIEPKALEVRATRAGLSVRARRSLATAPPVGAARARALGVLDDPAALGELPVAASLTAGPAGTAQLALEVRLDQEFVRLPAPNLRVATLLVPIEGDLVFDFEVQTVEGLARAGLWNYQRTFEPPDELAGAVVVVEDLLTGRWGAARVSYDQDASAVASGGTRAPGAPAVVPVGPRPVEKVLVVLPPTERPATGRTRFQALTTTDAVQQVAFYLDGKLVETDTRPPFDATLDLGRTAAPHEVRAVAISASGATLGDYVLPINQRSGVFSATVTEIEGELAAGSVTVTAQVVVPSGARLARVEFYDNETLVETLTAPPFRARIPTPNAQPGDYVRVLAVLADGREIEDVRLIDERIASARVAVNLVELTSVVTDRQGKPVENLTVEDFTVLRRGKPQTVESFRLADDVPLTLGLVVDSSGSMWALMEDTRRAASSFLVNTVRSDDQAFLVEFDDRPRLIAEPTNDIPRLLNAFGRLQASGATALYDALNFSLVQFADTPGRSALVLLTDGEDYGSRSTPRQCVAQARKLGVPIYVISLVGLDTERARATVDPILDGMARSTGGRTYQIREIQELAEAYGQINAELRNQYVLTLATDGPLDDAELAKIEVKVKGSGLSARTAIGQR